MSDRASAQSRKRSATSSKRTDSTRTTPYSGHFEQKLIDNGVYPADYEHPDGRLAPEPANLGDIQAAQDVPRASLSPSRFTDEDFRAFKLANAKVSGETTALHTILPLIAGNEGGHRFEMDLPFTNLQPFDKDLSDAKPDVYHGAAVSTVHPRVRTDLGTYIIPSVADISRPIVPNFSFEGKGVQGRADVAKRQAMHDGALGARAMHHLLNYKAEEPQYDNKARSFSATYHAGTGTLQTYAHHITAPLAPGGQPEYHMTQLDSFGMTGNIKTFRQGATVYRHNRDLAKTERDSAIAHANQVARQMPAPSPDPSLTASRSSRSAAIVPASDTSKDKLARDEVTPVKRPRQSVTSAASYGSMTGRGGRTASDTPMASSLAPLKSPMATTSTPRHGRRPLTKESILSQPSIFTEKGVNRPSTARPSEASGPSQIVQDAGQRRQSRSMTEVTSKRIRQGDEWGWSVEHRGKAIFVVDSQWSYCEQGGRPALSNAHLNIFTYLPTGNEHR